MTLTKTRLGAGAQTVTVKRFTLSDNDAQGNPVAPTETVLSTQPGLVQPAGADIRDETFGMAENVGDITHHGFIETRITGVRVKDHMFDAAGVDYLISFVHDFGGSIPQQFDLKIVTDQETAT